MQQWHNPKISHLELNTTIGLKDIETTSHKNGIWLVMFRLTCAGIVGCSCYILRLNRSINSKRQFLDRVTVAFSERCDFR